MLKLNSFKTEHFHHNHELGICIASLQPKSYDDVIYKLKELSSLTKFDFIEGINDREIMLNLIKDYPCYTLGSLIRDPNGDIYKQFEDSCKLASELNIDYLMFGSYKTRIQNDIDYAKFFGLAKKYKKHLLLEPLKGTARITQLDTYEYTGTTIFEVGGVMVETEPTKADGKITYTFPVDGIFSFRVNPGYAVYLYSLEFFN